MGDWHPDSPARISAISDALVAAGLDALLQHHEAPAIARADLERVHDSAYIDSLGRIAPSQGYHRIDDDTFMNPNTLAAAYHAAGAGVKAVELVLSGAVENCFCNIRPPGHHAQSNRAMGFCFFNNVAIAAAHALTRPGINRVLIADFDLHFGNGTEQIFADSDEVMICSAFQDRMYPHAHYEEDSDRIINVALPAGTGSAEFRQLLTEQWLPAIDAFAPDFVLLSAGFDAHFQDPFSELRLNDSDYSWLTQRLMELADRHADGRVVSTLEGGYNLQALARSALAHIRALMRIPQYDY